MNEKFHRIIFIIIAIAISATMFSLVSDYGSSIAEDEYQINNAIQLDRYYKSFGNDTSILENTRPMYSGWFNALTVTLSDVFAKFEIRSVRHTTNAIFGFVGILFAALLAKRCRNWRTASFTMLLLGLSPVIFGHSMFNLDDIPVFATFAASLFFVKRLADHFPKPKIVDAVFFALSSALCITANPDCSLIVAIALILCIIGLVAQRKHNEIKKAAIRYPIFAVGSLAVIFGIVILLIPQGIGEWLNSFSPNSPTRILFEGKLVWTDLLPWYYNTKMLVMTIPAAVFVGMLLALGLCFVKKSNRAEIITLVCISAVSILIFSLKSDTNGIWQHLLYAEIPLYIVAAIGFDMLAESSRSTATQIAGIAIPLLLMIMPAVHIFRSHPYSHIYYNEFTGGLNHAFGRYELENYGVSNLEAAQWIIDNGKYNLSGDQLFVAARSEKAGKHYFGKYKYEVSIVETRWAERANHIWDYAIFPVTGIEPEILTSQYFPPKNTVDTISIDNVPICLVLQRTDTCDLYGRGYLANNDVQHAIELLEMAVYNDPTNESAMINLIDANLRINNKDAMKKWIDRFLEIAPRDDVGNYYNAYYHNITGNNDEAERISKEIIDYNPRFSLAYMFLSTVYTLQKRYDEAENIVLSLVDYDIYDEQAARQLVRVYNAQQKDISEAELSYYDYASKSYDRRGKKELAEKYRKLYEETKAKNK
ncbi:MAG: hypothetical protein IKK36_01435 [Bacteroidales bacterium]|nr:hypothetical protein [Bacteroidales bacterium]